MNDAQARGRRTLLFITLLFVVPIVMAMFMYFSDTAIPVGSAAKGRLIAPPKVLPQETFLRIWSLVVLTDDECDTTCLTALENIRQIRLSLGAKMTRVQTVFIPASETAIRPDLADEHPVLIVVDPGNSKEIRNIVGAYKNGEVFLVDPLGNLMMSYPAGSGMGDIRTDVTHLLKLSGIG